MDWSDSALVLRSYPHGETSIILEVLTLSYGKQRGLLKGAKRLKHAGAFDIGNCVHVRWRGRLETQLGYFTLEPLAHMTAALFFDPLRLTLVSCVSHLLHDLLVDGESMPALFRESVDVLKSLTSASYAYAYLRWEFALLAHLGYGIGTTACVATGSTTDLCYVSPKSWQVVSRGAGFPYHNRLLPFPAFFLDSAVLPSDSSLVDGLKLTSYFLGQVYGIHRKHMPTIRQSLML